MGWTGVMVDEYEIELRLRHRTDGRTVYCPLTIYAYRVSDVPVQAIHVINKTHPVDEWNVEVMSLGPPKRLVELAAKQIQLTIETTMAALTKAAKGK